jgi:hypothetical protein
MTFDLTPATSHGPLQARLVATWQPTTGMEVLSSSSSRAFYLWFQTPSKALVNLHTQTNVCVTQELFLVCMAMRDKKLLGELCVMII